ncbi:hypothetical protein [Novosphingobium pokkalii]|uniref:Uncharacterized protein n=2 Tax=Novosphingobium pokkalii TaxID=1770194 RepID=A0ABV7UZR2_9SPHN|nr:hypothetical protein [Novosphingobium pokkalii]
MIRHIAVATRANRARYREMVGDIGLPSLHLATTGALAAFDHVNGSRRQ